MEVLYKYNGAGIVSGLPARDILADETEYHEIAEENSKTGYPCYVKVKAPKVAKAADGAKDNEGAKP